VIDVTEVTEGTETEYFFRRRTTELYGDTDSTRSNGATEKRKRYLVRGFLSYGEFST